MNAVVPDRGNVWEPFRRIGAIANRAVPQVSPWLAAKEAVAVLRAVGADEALVVDGDGTPRGSVTRACLEAGRPDAYAGQRMAPIGAVLHESVPLSVAASLVRALGVDRIAVVSDGRRAIGMLRAADLAAWDGLRARPESRNSSPRRSDAREADAEVDGTSIALSPTQGDEP